ncbi:hypothetical protein F511_32368 [Dorcoceras hygrometricum]|uniref:Retrotransposon gag domain-containing protein n=1 Tax=Dorcoceras hygrometricum TaxID=472368 RepID=A0A2Z7D659_9LAMI|nr:hypothetical protein F511_32368 [Dorcoceras hygrometricum]
MPPRRRGRGRGQFQEESEGQNEEEVQRSVPRRGRNRQVDLEVDELVARVEDTELVMARFQQMNPQTFNGDRPSSDAESWLQHITGLFDRVRYDDERRLSLAMFQLRISAQSWWREFNNLVQGSMFVGEYARRFSSLLAYVPHVSGREKAKRNKFMEGLNEELYSFVLAGSPTSYAEAVGRAIDIEEGL